MKHLAPALAVLAALVLVYLAATGQGASADGSSGDYGDASSSGLADLVGADAPLADPDLPPSDSTEQTPTLLESAMVAISPSTYMDGGASVDQAQTNRRAFRDMLAYSEGVAPGVDGYRTMFGGRLCASLADHPRQYFPFRDKNGVLHTTSAAGRYQFLVRTWDALAAKLQLPDFGPASQDAACDELVRQRGALADVDAGRIGDAIAKCAPTWASLPGSAASRGGEDPQHENKLADLAAAYRGAGGTLEA